MQYNEKGFVEGLPLPQGEWRNLSPDQPPGMIVIAGEAPPGVFMVHNYLSRTVCDQLAADCEAAASVPCTVYNPAPGEKIASRETAERVSENIDEKQLGVDVTGLVRNAFSGVIAPHFRMQLRSFERPEVLKYREGGHYVPHADAESWSAAGRRWDRVLDRDLSLILYFNDGYRGGELIFPNFGFSISPQKGLLVAFPSDSRYAHAAQPVAAGVRYAIVSWAAAKGGRRVETAPRPGVVNF